MVPVAAGLQGEPHLAPMRMSLDRKMQRGASVRHGCDAVVSCKVRLGSSTLQVKPQINFFFLKKLSQKQGFGKTVSVRHKLILDDLWVRKGGVTIRNMFLFTLFQSPLVCEVCVPACAG